MQRLSQHLVVPVEDNAGRRAQLVYAPAEHIRIEPYAASPLRMALYVLLVICTGTIYGIVSVWFPQIFTRTARAPLPYSRVGEADYILVLVHEDGAIRSQWVEVKVHRPAAAKKQAAAGNGYQEISTPTIEDKQPWVWFEFKKHRYVFNYEKGEFERYLATVREDLDKMRARLDVGLDDASYKAKVDLFGKNLVDIAAPFVPKLIFKKVVHPFYIFQIFSIFIWMNQNYVRYALVILALSIVSMIWEIYCEVSSSNRLRELVKSDYKVQVLRAGASSAQKMVTLHETELVPGDIIELTTGPVVADVLLLSGSCIVDEASLTGEAVPISKEAARGSGMITESEARLHYKASFLHSGSTITRVREGSGPCKAVVLSTGFSTGKGELFRSILFPRTIKFAFERDSYRYLAVLSVVAVIVFIKRAIDYSKQGYTSWYLIVNSLDLVTMTVPPALPIVLTSGIGFSLNRLNLAGIFCIDSQRVNSCGQLDTFCFDKTGTLTEESLRLVGLDVVDKETQRFARLDAKAEDLTKHLPEQFRLAMATCHSLSEVDGELQGYSLELSMFAAASLPLEFVHSQSEPYMGIVKIGEETYGIVKRFPFDAACQRSSVVVEHTTTKQRLVFVKGSPEAVSAVAVDTPIDFAQTSLRYAAEGNYCIGFGVRALAANESINIDDRAAIETSLNFMGIALFNNELKPESKGMLRELYDADIDVRMITGDNALTAVHVARLLEMPLKARVAIVDVNEDDAVVYHCVDSLRTSETQKWEPFTEANLSSVLAEFEVALTGGALEQLKTSLSEESLKQLLLQTQIFARIRPALKSFIVEKLMDYDKVVGMCGDGTNDCGALKAAHVGLALSSAEASIVAPFTSKAKAVTDVPVLFREGRCALTTSFLGFKFMVLYPLIQLAMSIVLGDVGIQMSGNQFLWDDLAIVLGLSMLMMYTAASPKLTKERPPNSLFSISIVASILGQLIFFIAFYIAVWIMMRHLSYFCKRSDGMDVVRAYMEDPSYVNTTAFSPKVVENCMLYTEPDVLSQIDVEVDDIFSAYESTVVWLWCHLAYFSVALAFNLRDRFRKPFWTNYYFTAFFVICLGINIWFLLDESNPIEHMFHTFAMTSGWRWTLFVMFVAQFVVAQVWELFATWMLPAWRLERETREKNASEKAIAAHANYVKVADDSAAVNIEAQPVRS